MVEQGGDVEVGGGGEVGDEALVAGGVFAEGGDGFADLGVAFEDGVDLAELDAVAAEFDLVVGAAEADQPAVAGPVGEVTGVIDALAGAFGVLDESGRGQLGLVPVSGGDPGPADPQLAAGAGRGPAAGGGPGRRPGCWRSGCRS